MKKKYLFIFILTLFLAISLAGCTTKTEENTPDNTQDNSLEDQPILYPADPDAPDMSVDHSDLASDFVYMGKDDYGYLPLPSNWVNYYEFGSDSQDISFSDVSGKTVVTLNSSNGRGSSLTHMADSQPSDIQIGDYLGTRNISEEDEVTVVLWTFEVEENQHTILLNGTPSVVEKMIPHIEKGFLLVDPNPSAPVPLAPEEIVPEE